MTDTTLADEVLKTDAKGRVRTPKVRREALHRLGLPEVRQHRLKRLDEEERAWAAELPKREQILPELQPVMLLRVEAGNG